MATAPQVTKPDLVVGVDFGMTCTGVAYANLSRGDIVRTVQRWPGRGQANENKVPTIIVYSRTNGSVTSWGFASESRLEQNNNDRLYVDWFKVYLDETLLKSLQSRDPENTPGSIGEVEHWFVDYLSCLYKHLEFKLAQELPPGKSWDTALVEFIFSVPTTWAPHPTVERFRSIVRRAGFAAHAGHSISVGLTEAEAAAVATSVEAPGIFAQNDNLLVCDAGGGTTDLSVLNVASIGANVPPSLKQLDVVIGRNIGSVKIDEAFEALAYERLKAAAASKPFVDSTAPADPDTKSPVDIEDAAWLMMKSREYQNAKCDHGSPDDTPLFFVPIPDLPASYTNAEHGISAGAMSFSQTDMRTLFDVQIARLHELIDRQLVRFSEQSAARGHEGASIAHLILSGGLGNSAYVQAALRARYASGSSAFPCAANLQIHVAPDPQLAVAKGIVHDRLRKLTSGTSVLGWRCARASYGTLCKVRYRKKDAAHEGQITATDPLDGKVYVTRVVEWFIRQGEPVNADAPLSRPFRRKLQPHELADRSFTTNILTCSLPASSLPFTAHSPSAQPLCDVVSDLSSIPPEKFKLKNRHWWSFGKPYRRCNYDIKVVLGAADMSFELWHDGEKVSRDNPISVEWMELQGPAQGVVELEGDEPGANAVSGVGGVGGVGGTSGANGTATGSGTNGTAAAPLNMPAISKSRKVGERKREEEKVKEQQQQAAASTLSLGKVEELDDAAVPVAPV